MCIKSAGGGSGEGWQEIAVMENGEEKEKHGS